MNDTARPPLLIRMPLELRWRDLDAFDHVNNASFMTVLEETRVRISARRTRLGEMRTLFDFSVSL